MMASVRAQPSFRVREDELRLSHSVHLKLLHLIYLHLHLRTYMK